MDRRRTAVVTVRIRWPGRPVLPPARRMRQGLAALAAGICAAGLAASSAAPAGASAAVGVQGAAAAPAAPSSFAAPAPPRRVVSMNLCTDQIAMLLAAPGQLVSVSNLARDPQASAMLAQAEAYPVNHGQAEEIFLMRPDLVLAGSYAGPPVAMLERLGVRVVTLPPPQSLQDARDAIASIAAAMGRDEAAAPLLARFDAALARHPAAPPAGAPLAATWAPNGYSAGSRTLAGDVLSRAGFALLADRLGMEGAGTIPLESLVIAAPALVVTGTRYPGATRADDIATHPVMARASARRITIPDADWTCPIPQVLDVLDRLTAVADQLG